MFHRYKPGFHICGERHGKGNLEQSRCQMRLNGTALADLLFQIAFIKEEGEQKGKRLRHARAAYHGNAGEFQSLRQKERQTGRR